MCIIPGTEADERPQAEGHSAVVSRCVLRVYRRDGRHKAGLNAAPRRYMPVLLKYISYESECFRPPLSRTCGDSRLIITRGWHTSVDTLILGTASSM